MNVLIVMFMSVTYNFRVLVVKESHSVVPNIATESCGKNTISQNFVVEPEIR